MKPRPTTASAIFQETVPPVVDETFPRYEVQVEAVNDAATGDLVTIRARALVGLGVGPHWGHSSRRLRAFGWALIHAADHIDEAAGPPPQVERLPFPTPGKRHRTG